MSYTYQIFFILTYPESYISYLELSTDDAGFANLKKINSKIKTYNNQSYITNVYSYNIIEDKLLNDNEDDKYVLNINLKQKKFLVPNLFYKGKIEFKEIRNHFVYNFKFDNLKILIKENTPPTNIITLSKIEKIKLYEETLMLLRSEPGDILSNDFCEDSIESIIKGKSFDIECYLELLKYCHTTNKIKKLLKYFNLKDCKISKNLRIEDYSPTLDKINIIPEIYMKYIKENDKIIKNKFYDLLLFYKMNYEKDKLKDLLAMSELWEFFADKINFNEKFYPLVASAEEGFIKIIMDQKKLSFKLIKEIIFSYDSFEGTITFIDKYLDKIKEICNYEESIRMTHSNSQKNIFEKKSKENNSDTSTDKIRKILGKKIKFLEKRKYHFVLFDEKYWNNFFIYDKIKIYVIDDTIFICQKIDKKFEEFKNKENNYVSQLNNEKLLIFLEKNLHDYDERNYEINYCNINMQFDIESFTTYKPLSLLDKIKINNLNEQFFEKWSTIKNKIFDLKDQRYILNPSDIIQKINNMNDFEKVLKLFYSKNKYDENNYQKNYEKKLIYLFSVKFINLIKYCKFCHYMPQNASFIIDLLINNNENPLLFMDEIEKIISDKKIIYEIYILLSSNLRISNEIISHIADNIFKNKDIFIIKKLNKIQKPLMLMILYKIDNNIEEKMLYDNEKINIFFKLLNDIEKEKLIQDYLLYKNDLNNISNILDNIDNGKISFKLLDSIFPNFDNKVDYLKTEEERIKLFRNKLSILLANQNNRVKIYMNKITNYLYKIYKEQKYIQETNYILKIYYKDRIDYDENIALLNKVLNKIKESNLNGIDNEPIKSYLLKIYKKFPDFDKKYILNYSSYFFHILNINKSKNKVIDETFKQVTKVFDELSILFEKNWELKIVKETCFNYYNIIKEEEYKKGEKLLVKELKILMNYHRLDLSIKELENIGDRIVIFILKQNTLSFLDRNLDLISNNSSYNYKRFKEELLKVKDIISYKMENEQFNLDNESVKTKYSD